MTTETITILVNEKGARVVNRSLTDVGKNAAKSQTGVNQLNRALRTLGGALSAAAVLRLADSYTNLQNRLKLVTSGTQELEAVTKSLFNISNETRSSYEATAEVYARTALATKELGLSQQQTLDFTKSLNQAVILSGASAAEAQAGMIQLSQGLASGTLRGDELRSVLEQLPKVADVIAESMGVTRGELRELGTEGKIGARDIILAFQRASGSLEDDFGKTVPTVSQSLVILRNNFQQVIGEMDKAFQITATLAMGIKFLSENLKTVGSVLVIVAGAWAAYRLQMILTAAVTSGLAIGQTIVAFLQLAATVRSVAAATALLNLTLIGPGALIAILGAVAAAGFIFRDEITASIIAVMAEVIIWVDKAFQALDRFKNFTTEGLSASVIGVKNLLGIISDEQAQTALLELGGQDKSPASLFGVTPEQIRAARDELIGEIASDKGGKDKFNIADLLGVGGVDLESLTGAGAEAMKASLERQKELLEDIQAPQLDFNLAQQDLNALYEEGLISLQEYNNELAKQEGQFLQNFESSTFAEGFINQIKKMQLETKNATAKMGADFASIFGPGGQLSKGIGDAVAGAIVFGRSWQESIRQVAQSILSQLISSLVQVGVNMLINATLGKTLMAAAAATSAASGAATAAAWAPAAAAVSAATFGASAAAGTAALATTFATSKALSSVGGGLPGFESGGFTGGGGRSQVAGVVHGQEFVMNASATARNRSSLEAMNRGDSVGRQSSGGTTVNIINEIPDAEFETSQISPNQVEIIARRVVREDAPAVIATDISNPNSRTSKALAKNTQTTRRRQ